MHLHSIATFVVEKSPCPDPVGVAVATLQAIRLDGEPIVVDGATSSLQPGAPWPLGASLDISHPALPITRMRHRVWYTPAWKTEPAMFRIDIRFDGENNTQIPADVTDIALQIARGWIELRDPSWVFACGSGETPAGTDLSAIPEVAWWTWSGDFPEATKDSQLASAFAGGLAVQLTPTLDAAHPLPSPLGAALGLDHEPRVLLGLGR